MYIYEKKIPFSTTFVLFGIGKIEKKMESCTSLSMFLMTSSTQEL